MLAYLMTLSSEFIGYLCRATSFSRIFLFGNKCDLQHLRTVSKNLVGSLRDVVFLGWPIALSYMSPNARGGGGCRVSATEYIFLLEMKQGRCICPLSWSVHWNFAGDGKCNERGWACTPHPLPAWANFTLMMECAAESSRYYYVYSVVSANE